MNYIIGGIDTGISDFRSLSKEQMLLYWSEQREIEQDWNFRSGAELGYERCKIYSENFIKRFIKIFGIEGIYQDYSPRNNCFGDRKISSFFTSHGIKQIDSFISKKIQVDNLLEIEIFKDRILRQPNLHPIIRNNLYQNLINLRKCC